MTETPQKSSETFDLDSILAELGSFGKFQRKNFILFCIPFVLNAFFTLSYVFTAGVVPHRCAIPECESHPKDHWIPFAIPQKSFNNEPELCSRFTPLINKSNILAPSCTADSFNRSSVVACDDIVFDTQEITISNEWNITCDENKWKLSIVGTINNFGQFICTSITGMLSDRYGRRITLVAGLMFGAVFGILRSISRNYLMFVLFEFMDTLFSAGTASVAFVLGMEFLQPQHRTIGGLTFSALYPVGGMIIALLAYLLQNWRYLLLALYVPALFTIFLYWMISESMRWLHTKSRMDELSEIIQTAAKMNNIQLSEKSLEMLRSPLQSVKNTSEEKEETLLSIFKFKRMFFIFINLTFCMLVNTLVYTGLSIYAVHLGGNKYLNFTIVNLIELPSHVLAYFLLEKAGRRYSMSGTMILTGVFCIASEILPVDATNWKFTSFMMAKFLIATSFSVFLIFSLEMVPTSIRNSLVGIGVMFSRIGAILAPQTPLLATIYPSLPMLIFAVFSIFTGILALSFPETSNQKLPDTIEDVLNLGKSEKKKVEIEVN